MRRYEYLQSTALFFLLCTNFWVHSSLNQVKILPQQLHMFLSYADIPAHLCPRERKINIISGSLTPAEIPISILPAGHTDIKAQRK